MAKKQVSSYLTEEEARILKESAYTQTDLLREDIIRMVYGNNDYYSRIRQSEALIEALDKIINILLNLKEKEEKNIMEYQETLKQFSLEETEDAREAIKTFNNVLKINNDNRFKNGVSGFGINKVPLSVAMSIARDGNINLRSLLSNADEKLMRKELEGYSTLLKRWKVKNMKELLKN